ncbi:hypothetical protein AAZX31_12G132600 [Glycine max]|uniref:Knottin scorpion toxin-like domain-containing protein n=2 Tax=Glycine subgen. Soja TaxID=1462606 RepID=I1LSX0_SOYBN|nr:hypothetical protein JHK87_033726 [Glycine soja]KAH1143135.1 hypothetical protein GYH30_033713 [Glycine max]KRH25969.1 hypothetical protein GLYMA_12G142600v4 [Glycine max]RZB75797.1 hypothetical protein D0Y65_034338 [Glycine soja]
MTKISFTIIFALALFFTVISKTSETMIENQCSTVLDPNDCNLSWCQSNCRQQYQGFGSCVDVNPHKCVCIYDCSPKMIY